MGDRKMSDRSRREFIGSLSALAVATRLAPNLQEQDTALFWATRVRIARARIHTLHLRFDAFYTSTSATIDYDEKRLTRSGSSEFFLDLPNRAFKLVHYRNETTLIQLGHEGRYMRWADAPGRSGEKFRDEKASRAHTAAGFAWTFLNSWLPVPRDLPTNYLGTTDYRGTTCHVLSQTPYRYLVSPALNATLRRTRFADARNLANDDEFSDHRAPTASLYFPHRVVKKQVNPSNRQILSTTELRVRYLTVNTAIDPGTFQR